MEKRGGVERREHDVKPDNAMILSKERIGLDIQRTIAIVSEREDNTNTRGFGKIL